MDGSSGAEEKKRSDGVILPGPTNNNNNNVTSNRVRKRKGLAQNKTEGDLSRASDGHPPDHLPHNEFAIELSSSSSHVPRDLTSNVTTGDSSRASNNKNNKYNNNLLSGSKSGDTGYGTGGGGGEDGKDKEGGGGKRTGGWFSCLQGLELGRGLAEDFTARRAVYASDWTDAWKTRSDLMLVLKVRVVSLI